MPSGVGPATANTDSPRQRDASLWFDTMTCAHFNPAMFHAFDADVTVIVCSAAVSDTVAYGTWTAPGYTRGACTSSATTRAPWRSTIAASDCSSSRVNTRPVG